MEILFDKLVEKYWELLFLKDKYFLSQHKQPKKDLLDKYERLIPIAFLRDKKDFIREYIKNEYSSFKSKENIINECFEMIGLIMENGFIQCETEETTYDIDIDVMFPLVEEFSYTVFKEIEKYNLTLF